MKRKYKAAWEEDPEFSSWVTKSKDKDDENAQCKACNCKILPRMASLKEHMATTKHKKTCLDSQEPARFV